MKPNNQNKTKHTKNKKKDNRLTTTIPSNEEWRKKERQTDEKERVRENATRDPQTSTR